MTFPMIFDTDTPRARRKDPIESHEAADGNDLWASQAEVRAILEILGEATDDMVLVVNEARLQAKVAITKLTPSRGRTARQEIGAEPVEVDGKRKRAQTRTGASAQVWRLK